MNKALKTGLFVAGAAAWYCLWFGGGWLILKELTKDNK